MLTTNNFLGCSKLETGGLVIGWLSLISNVLAVSSAVVLSVVLSVFDCQEIKEFLIKFDEGNCKFARTVAVAFLVIVALFGLGLAIISFLCIKGVENRDHVRVRPMMIVCGIMTVIALLGILSFTAYGVGYSIIYGVIFGYTFVVFSSLFDIFQQERLSGSNSNGRSTAKYQLPMGKALEES